MYAKLGFLIILLFLSSAAWALPKIEHWVLPNGTRVYFVESHEIPMVKISAIFDAGSARDAPGKLGLARMTNRMLAEGADDLDANEIAIRFENLGAEFGTSSETDMAAVSVQSLSDKEFLEPALAVFTKVLLTPTFPENSLARERRRALIALQRIQQSPGDLASKAFLELLYNNHPYGTLSIGTEDGLKAITRKDLLEYHRRYYVAANAILAMVGDISVTQAKKIAEGLFGKLPAGLVPPPLPKVADLSRAIKRQLPYPASQSHILMGEPGIVRTDPDYFALYVGNYTLGGGGLVSRLTKEIREKQGLSYSVYSYFSPMKERGPFTLGLQTKNAQRDQALNLLRKILTEFIASGPTGEELQAAKKNLTGGFPLRIDSNGKILDYLALIGFYRLPLTYLEDFIPRIEAVTVEQIRDAFKRRIDPERMATVIVGGESP
jgi:zinc protease